MTTTTTSRRRPVRWAVTSLAAAALLSGCAASNGDEAIAPDAAATTRATTSGTTPPSPTTAPVTTSPDVETSSTAPASGPATAPASDASTTDEAGGVPTSLLAAPFSGYPDVQEEVVAWSLECPPDFEAPVPQQATTMGTARQNLDPESFTIRQVAVFNSAEDAAEAADALSRYAQEECAGQYEPQPGFVASRSTVQPLYTGDQGVLVDTVAEDNTSSTAVLRRGTAVALVKAAALPPYPGGRSAVEDVRTAVPSVYEQLCRYEENAC